MQSKRQQQIVQMVKGYDSTFTISVALRNLFLIWALYGMALTVTGVLASAANPFSENGATTQRTLDAVRASSVPLFLLTLVFCGAWMAKSVANVRRVGRKATIGLWSRVRKHILAGCFSLLALAFAFIIPPLGPVLILTALGLAFYSQMWAHLVLLDAVKMLWGTSSPPNGQHEDVDHYVLIWFWSWVVFVSLLASNASPTDVAPQTLAALSVVAGISCVASALLASRLVMSISKRQDARLFAIIHEVDPDVESKPVTNEDIAAAWDKSAAYIEMPH